MKMGANGSQAEKHILTDAAREFEKPDEGAIPMQRERDYE